MNKNYVVDKVTQIKIPSSLYTRIKKITGKTGFKSPEDFIVHVLREIVAEYETILDTETNLTEEEEKEIIEKLRSLGYL